MCVKRISICMYIHMCICRAASSYHMPQYISSVVVFVTTLAYRLPEVTVGLVSRAEGRGR